MGDNSTACESAVRAEFDERFNHFPLPLVAHTVHVAGAYLGHLQQHVLDLDGIYLDAGDVDDRLRAAA
jgi:hypothetical protein